MLSCKPVGDSEMLERLAVNQQGSQNLPARVLTRKLAVNPSLNPERFTNFNDELADGSSLKTPYMGPTFPLPLLVAHLLQLLCANRR